MSTEATAPAKGPDIGPVPKDWIPGLIENWKYDLMSGLILSLIALPLCLGIAIASGAPPVAGLIAGILGGMLVTFTSGSYVTINGPAAGLIVVVLGAVDELGVGMGESPEVGFQRACAVGVVIGGIQILLGLIKAGKVTNFFNLSVIHGMLAGIGIIIMAKMFHPALGVKPESHLHGMIGVISAIPDSLSRMVPDVALIGAVALVIMIVWPFMPKILGKIAPAPLVLAIVGLFMATSLGVTGKYLLEVPLDFFAALKAPDFSVIFTGASLKWMVVYLFVNSLESLLTAAAIDQQDPWKRTSNMNKEFIGKGSGNLMSSLVCGLPMIAEVVRSAANVMNGARTRWSNFFHGTFLLLFVLSIPAVLNMIPIAALSGMLVFIGFRLAHPKEFKHVLHCGKEEFAFMLVTTILVVVEDLLVGVAVGTLVAMITNVVRGVPMGKLFSVDLAIEDRGDTVVAALKGAAGFHSFISFRGKLDTIPNGKKLILDFSQAGFIDHTVHGKLTDFEVDYVRLGGTVTRRGLENHVASSHSPVSSLVRTA